MISQFQISGRKSETLCRGFKLSAEDLDVRPRVWVWIWILVYKFSADVLAIRYLAKTFNVVLKLTQENKSNIINIHWQISTSCLVPQFQMSNRTSETLDWEFKVSAEDLDIRPKVWVWIWRLVYISLAEVLGFIYPPKGFIKSGP